jgi:ankyrin repeat protein
MTQGLLEEQAEDPTQSNIDSTEKALSSEEDNGQSMLYDALLQAATLGQSTIAIALLRVGADPNFGFHGGRLSKVSGRMERKRLFRSSPMHLACLKGDDTLVKELLERNSKFNSPDAAGVYPLHLASSGLDTDERNQEQEDLRRLECVKALFEAGAPMAMRDGNKQSVLHAAARAGHWRLLKYVMARWNEENGYPEELPPKHFFNWMDRWHRKYYRLVGTWLGDTGVPNLVRFSILLRHTDPLGGTQWKGRGS